jgi:hypothetical protein
MVGGDPPVRLYAFFRSRPGILKFFWKSLDNEVTGSLLIQGCVKDGCQGVVLKSGLCNG